MHGFFTQADNSQRRTTPVHSSLHQATGHPHKISPVRSDTDELNRLVRIVVDTCEAVPRACLAVPLFLGWTAKCKQPFLKRRTCCLQTTEFHLVMGLENCLVQALWDANAVGVECRLRWIKLTMSPMAMRASGSMPVNITGKQCGTPFQICASVITPAFSALAAA